jgi:hypothetical protein
VYSKSRRGRVLRQVLGCMSLPIVPTWCFPIYIRHFTELGIDSVTINERGGLGAQREKSMLCGLDVDISIAAWSPHSKEYPNANV